MLKTMDLVSFRLMVGKDLNAEFGPCNRKFQGGQNHQLPARMATLWNGDNSIP